MKTFLFTLIFTFTSVLMHGQEIIPLYEGKAPAGSEKLTSPEKQQKDPEGNIMMVSSVSMPTLTVYKPDSGKANGTTIVVCPGGAFRFLSFTSKIYKAPCGIFGFGSQQDRNHGIFSRRNSFRFSGSNL